MFLKSQRNTDVWLLFLFINKHIETFNCCASISFYSYNLIDSFCHYTSGQYPISKKSSKKSNENPVLSLIQNSAVARRETEYFWTYLVRRFVLLISVLKTVLCCKIFLLKKVAIFFLPLQVLYFALLHRHSACAKI